MINYFRTWGVIANFPRHTNAVIVNNLLMKNAVSLFRPTSCRFTVLAYTVDPVITSKFGDKISGRLRFQELLLTAIREITN